MNRIACAVILIAACDNTASLKYEIKTTDEASTGTAAFADVANAKPSVDVKGTAGDYVDAIRAAVVAQKEPAQVSVIIGGNEPQKKSGHLDISLEVNALWWALPDTTKAHATLAVKLDYKATSPADVGKQVGEVVVHYLDSRRPKHAALPSLAPPAIAVAVGKTIACSLHGDKSVHCWGDQLEPLVGDVPSKTPIANAVEIAAGDDSMCARLESGDVKCLGKIDSIEQSKPHAVAKVCDLVKPIKLAVGEDSACAIVDGGKVRCWNPNVLDSVEPSCAYKSVEVKGIVGATTIASGYRGLCALVAGKAICWQTRDDTAIKSTKLSGVDAFYGFDPCVIDAAGQFSCEKKGAGTTTSAQKLPPGSKVALEAMYGCAITPTSQLLCFGAIPDGLFGLAAPAQKTNVFPPTPVLDNAISVGVAIDTACAVTKAGAVMCASEATSTDPGLAASSPKLTKLAIY
jgi:hypothetical protein